MSSRDAKSSHKFVPLLTRTTILILCAVLFWLYFVGDATAPTTRLALIGGVVGVIGYTGLLFSKTETRSPASS